MRIGLTRGNEWLTITRAGWEDVLDTAVANGWVPKGTMTPEWEFEDGTLMWGHHPDTVDDWGGSYRTNDGRWVEDDDASNLAWALEKAIVEDPHTYDWLIHMIAFAAGGGFFIW